MRAHGLVLLLVLSAGCGAADPCDDHPGACVTLTVTSSVVSSVDRLDVTAFGATKTSMRGATSLPVRLAVVPPANTTGTVPITVQGLLVGKVVGAGMTAVEIGSGRTAATVNLVAGGASCDPTTPDRCGDNCVDLQSNVQNCGKCGTACAYAHAGAKCVTGACQIGACESGWGDCANGPMDGCETNTATDAANCGGCGKKCLVGQLCKNGACADNLVTCASTGITCAKDGCSTGKFAISAGGRIAVDTANGRRLWTRATRGPATYSAAKSDCATLALEGVVGWRLPMSFAEVPTFMTGGLNGCPTCEPAVDQAAFPDTKVTEYWTSAYNANRMGYDTVNYCDGRNNYQTAPDQLLPYRCTHDPL